MQESRARLHRERARAAFRAARCCVCHRRIAEAGDGVYLIETRRRLRWCLSCSEASHD